MSEDKYSEKEMSKRLHDASEKILLNHLANIKKERDFF